MIKYIVVILIFVGCLYKSYLVGMDVQAGIEAQARQTLIEEQQKKVIALQAIKNKVEVKYRDKVKTIYKVVDPTGCLDHTLSDVGLLRPASDN